MTQNGSNDKIVSVVIPTTGRVSLARAVDSAARQTIGRSRIEILVVCDLPDGALAEPPAQADRVLYTGGVGNGGYARQIGVNVSLSPWVAFLDDDDTWMPEKLAVQLAAVRAGAAGGVPTAIASRFHERLDGGHASASIPTALVGQGDPLEDYLFRARSATVGRAAVPTSVLMVNRAAAAAVPWDTNLSRHQDWDWLCRFSRLPERVFVHTPGDVVELALGSAGSISASSDWESSLEWARRWAEAWRPRTLVDFIVGQPLRYALQQRSVAGVRACICAVAARRRFPSARTILLAASGIMPRKLAERAFVLMGRARRSK